MEGGEIYNNALAGKQDAVIVIKEEGKFVKSGGRIYNNTSRNGNNDNYQRQVQFYGWYGGGYWGNSIDNLTPYKTGNRGTTDNHYFLTESDVEAASQ